MKMKRLLSVLALSTTALLVSCGQGQDLLGTVAYNNSSFPQLGPITTTFINTAGWGGIQFTAANPFWAINSAYSFGGSYISSADGVVTSIGVGTIANTQTNYVTIAHSGRLATRIWNISIVNVRIGDQVQTGSVIGSFFSSGFTTAYFQVLLDGTPRCPLSFVSDTFRAQIIGQFGSPCL